ncbi:MAG: M56 family metallopeptidase [Nitrospirae bacterium]|nr:M56 family metallopeptidase [Nitrospirota bacterium]
MSAQRQATALFWGMGSMALLVSGVVVGEIVSGGSLFQWGWQMVRICGDQVLAWCLSLPGGTGILLLGLGAVLFIVSWLWALGRAGRMLMALRSELRGLRERPLPSLAAQQAAASGLSGRVLLFASPVAQAFTAGFLHPRIYLSTELLETLEEDELRAVLLHEAHHQVRRDPLRIFLATLLKDAFWYLPVVRALWKEFIEAKERAADDAASRMETFPLAGALLKLAAKPRVPALTGMPAFHGPRIEERVRRLLLPGAERRTLPTWRATLGSFIIAAILLASVAAPAWTGTSSGSCAMTDCPMWHQEAPAGVSGIHHCEGY